MKKDYSKVFSHYYGLKYDDNVNDMIKIHYLMENAGIQVSSSTKSKLDAYSDKRPFKVHYFISKLGKTLKWCPTNSPEKFDKMTLMAAEWWIEQLTDGKPVDFSTKFVQLPENWLEIQALDYIRTKINIESDPNPVKIVLEDELIEEYIIEELEDHKDDTLPF